MDFGGSVGLGFILVVVVGCGVSLHFLKTVLKVFFSSLSLIP